MLSRVSAVAKLADWFTTSRVSRPRRGAVLSCLAAVTQPQSRHFHVPTQSRLLRTASLLSLSSLHYISHRHQRYHQHHYKMMDAALAKIFSSNAQWVKAVNAAEPNFFSDSAKGQTPKVRLRLLFFHSHVPWRYCPLSFCVVLYAHSSLLCTY